MDQATQLSGIARLAKAGQQAGFPVEQMIGLLNAGIGVKGLAELIAWRLDQPEPLAPVASCSGWVV